MIKISEMTDLVPVFKRYSGWAGADGIYSFEHREKVVWYFSDTFVGEADKNTDKRVRYSFVNNSFGLSSKNIKDISFVYPQDATSSIVPNIEGYYWLQDGVIIENDLYIFALRMKNQILENLPFSIKNVDLIKFNLNNISIFNYEIIESSDYFFKDCVFGASTFDNRKIDGYLYIYGYRNIPGNKQVILSRVKSDFNAKVEYLHSDGSWSSEKRDFKILASNFAAEFKVVRIKDKYYCAYTKDGIGKDICLVESDALESEFSNFRKIYECPEMGRNNNWIAYNAKIQQPLSNERELVISYSVNTLVNSEHQDLNIYYPRFIKAEL